MPLTLKPSEISTVGLVSGALYLYHCNPLNAISFYFHEKCI